MFVALTPKDYSRHPALSFSIAMPLPANQLRFWFPTKSIIKILNAL